MPTTAGITSLRAVLAGLASGSPITHLRGTGRSPSLDIDAVIEYRSKFPIYLNVTNWVDTFLVGNIDGVDDATVRYAAEDNPGDHGQTPFDSWYGGRTIVLTGKLMTRSRDKLHDMASGITGAFLDLQNEYPLIFHGSNPDNSVYVMCKKSSKFNMSKTQQHINEFQRNFQITLNATNPRFLSLKGEMFSVAGTGQNTLTFPGVTVPIIEDFSVVSPDGVTNGYRIGGDGWIAQDGLLIPNTASKPEINLVRDPRFSYGGEYIYAYWSRTNAISLVPKVDDVDIWDRYVEAIHSAGTDPFGVSQWTTTTGLYTPGDLRSVMCWVRSPNGSRKVSLEIDFLDESDETIDYQWSPEFTVGTAWTPVKLEAVPIPAGTEKIAFFCLVMNPQPGDKLHMKKPRMNDRATIDSYLDDRTLWGEYEPGTEGYIARPTKTYVTDRNFKNSIHTVKFRTGPDPGDSSYPNGFQDGLRIILAYIDDDNLMWAEIGSEDGDGRPYVRGRMNGEPFGVAYDNWQAWAEMPDVIPPNNTGVDYEYAEWDTEYWLQATKIGKVASVNLFSSDPNGAGPVYRVLGASGRIPDVVWEKFKNELPSGLSIQNREAQWKIDRWHYEEVPEIKSWIWDGGLGLPLVAKDNKVRILPGDSIANSMGVLNLPYKLSDQTITVQHGHDNVLVDAYRLGVMGKRVVDTSTSPASPSNPIDRWLTAEVWANSGATSYSLQLRRYFGSWFEHLGGVSGVSIPIDPATNAGDQMWVRLKVTGNVARAEFWTTDPDLGGTPLVFKEHTMTGEAAQFHGAGKSGDIGLYFSNADSANGVWLDNFTFTQPMFDGIVATPTNNGNFAAQTTIELTGPMTNPRIINEANGTSSYIKQSVGDTVIPAGETWVLENVGSSKRLYRKSDGANRMQHFHDTSGWVELAPGGEPNPIRFIATGLAPGWNVVMRHQHTWM